MVSCGLRFAVIKKKGQSKTLYCEPLTDALIAGIDKRFGTMMKDPKLLAASLIHPHFKTDWLIPNELIKVGKLYVIILVF